MIEDRDFGRLEARVNGSKAYASGWSTAAADRGHSSPDHRALSTTFAGQGPDQAEAGDTAMTDAVLDELRTVMGSGPMRTYSTKSWTRSASPSRARSMMSTGWPSCSSSSGAVPPASWCASTIRATACSTFRRASKPTRSLIATTWSRLPVRRCMRPRRRLPGMPRLTTSSALALALALAGCAAPPISPARIRRLAPQDNELVSAINTRQLDGPGWA